MKGVVIPVLLGIFLCTGPNAEAKKAQWGDHSKMGEAFWDEGSYETKSEWIFFLSELPSERAKGMFATSWWKGQKQVPVGSAVTLSSSFEITTKSSAGRSYAFLFIKGESGQFGKGWFFIGIQSPQVVVKAPHTAFQVFKESWGQLKWYKSIDPRKGFAGLMDKVLGDSDQTSSRCPPGKVWVDGYTRRDGTRVRGHCRSR